MKMTEHDGTLLETLLADWTETSEAAAVEPTSPTGAQVAEVVDERHPSLLGRVRVAWSEGAQRRQRWVPCLRGLAARTGDRVLLQHPRGAREPVVVGVIDGFEERPAPRLSGPSLELQADEGLTVYGHRGRPLLQVREGAHGPLVRLLRADVGLEVDGAFSLTARSIQLSATGGDARVEARDDVVVRGELIHLN